MFVCIFCRPDGAKMRKRDEFEEDVYMLCYEHNML